jgi:hypothetical protein
MKPITIPETAPEITPGYPYKRRLFPAWQEMWDLMRANPSEFLDGRVLAEEVAPRHDVVPATLTGVISRAARAGLLEVQKKDVLSGRGLRARSHYRIKV